MTATYPELGVLSRRVRVPVIVDGRSSRSAAAAADFALLQSRMHVRHPPGRLLCDVPVQLYLFDVL
jgi:ATP-dependent DNA ligase